MSGGNSAFAWRHRFVDRLGGLELVCARQQVDGHRAGGLAVEPSKGVVVLRAQLGASDVLDADLRAGFSLTDDDVLELLGVDEAPGGAHRVGELLVLRRRRGADAPGRRLQVLLFDCRDHIGRRERELGQLVGAQPDAHAIIGAAEKIDLGDAGDAQQLIAQVDAAIVGQKVRVVAPFGRVDGDDHQNARALLLDRDTLLDHLLRQARLSRRDPVLREHVGRVLVDADFKVDVELHAAVAGVRRLHVDHLIDAVDFLLDGRRYRLLHRHRRSARVGRRDSDGRRRQEWVLLDGETLEAEQPHQNQQDRNDDSDDGPADEKVCHGLFPPCLSLALGGRRVWSKRSFFFRLYSLGDDLHAGLHFLKSFHDNLFARLQS